MESSAPTPSEWLAAAAARLGLGDPGAALGAALDSALPGTLAATAPARNALLPGAAPLELSFSESAPAALRVDFEPLGWGSSPGEVRAAATAFVAAAIERRWGSGAREEFAARAAVAAALASGSFGAFAGASLDGAGLREAKVYYAAVGGAAPAATAPLVAAARAELPGLECLLNSVAVASGSVAERAYLVCRSQLDLLALEPLLARFDLAFRAPELILTMSRLTAGALGLGPSSAIVGLREATAGPELKLEVPLAGAARDSALATVAALLAERPPSQAAFRRWLAAVSLPGTTNRASVVSARVSAEHGVRLSAYVHPVAADREGERSGDPARAERVG